MSSLIVDRDSILREDGGMRVAINDFVGAVFEAVELGHRNSDGPSLLVNFPQFEKKQFLARRNERQLELATNRDILGVHYLSIDEIGLLRTNLKLLKRQGYLANTDDLEVLVSTEVEERIATMHRSCVGIALQCRIYAYLTLEKGLWLRHGGQFGVLYIAYAHPSMTHGEYLVVVVHDNNDVDEAQITAAKRVAVSVKKRLLTICVSSQGVLKVEIL